MYREFDIMKRPLPPLPPPLFSSTHSDTATDREILPLNSMASHSMTIARRESISSRRSWSSGDEDSLSIAARPPISQLPKPVVGMRRRPLPRIPTNKPLPAVPPPIETIYADVRPVTPVSPSSSSVTSRDSQLSLSASPGSPTSSSPRRLRRMKKTSQSENLRSLREQASWEALREAMDWGVSLYLEGRLH
jgi:hypothetical protein